MLNSSWYYPPRQSVGFIKRGSRLGFGYHLLVDPSYFLDKFVIELPARRMLTRAKAPKDIGHRAHYFEVHRGTSKGGKSQVPIDTKDIPEVAARMPRKIGTPRSEVHIVYAQMPSSPLCLDNDASSGKMRSPFLAQKHDRDSQSGETSQLRNCLARALPETARPRRLPRQCREADYARPTKSRNPR